jgi:hypothetical protein
MSIHRQGNGEIRIISAIAPTERSDGTPLSNAEISHYDWYIQYEGGTPLVQATQLVDGKFTDSVDVDTVGAGTYSIWYRTVDTEGRESIDSDILSLEILAPLTAPNPPTGVS